MIFKELNIQQMLISPLHIFKIYSINWPYNHLMKNTVILQREWFASGFWWILYIRSSKFLWMAYHTFRRSHCSEHTRRQLQSLLGKLSFVNASVWLARIFMSSLLNRLCTLSPKQSHFLVTSEILSDIVWWLTSYYTSMVLPWSRYACVTFMTCYLPVIFP